MLHGTTSVDPDVMQDVQRMVIDSQNIGDLCGKIARYWGVDDERLQTAAMEWRERTATRQVRAERANRLLQLETEQEEAFRASRQIKLELLVEQIAERVFPV